MMNQQSWRPTRIRQWQDFMETGFEEFYFEFKAKKRGPNKFLSSLLLLLCVTAICVTAVFV